MPEISRFFGIIIAMYYEDHAPPHFHVRYGGHRAAFQISNLGLIRGQLPARAHGLVMEWAAMHREELKIDWERARRRQPLAPIPPLE